PVSTTNAIKPTMVRKMSLRASARRMTNGEAAANPTNAADAVAFGTEGNWCRALMAMDGPMQASAATVLRPENDIDATSPRGISTAACFLQDLPGQPLR